MTKSSLLTTAPLVERVRVLTRGNAEMLQVLDRLNRRCIKVLNVEQAVDLVIAEKIAHSLGKTADAEAHADVSLLHDLGQGQSGGDGSAADTGLIGETVLEVGRIDDELCAVLGHEKLSLVSGRLRCAGRDLLRIADLVDDDDIVDAGLADVSREVRVRDKAVRDADDPVCVERIRHRMNARSILTSPVIRARTRPPWLRMIARPFSLPSEMAWPILPRTPEDWMFVMVPSSIIGTRAS